MTNRAPGVIWSLRGEPETSGYVRTADDDRIEVVLPNDPDLPLDHPSYQLISIVISRKDARLLAKRLNKCLDSTTYGTPWGQP